MISDSCFTNLTAAIWSFNPLMSLIDTAVIAWSGDRGLSVPGADWLLRLLGRQGLQGTASSSSSSSLLAIQLAAMGPATVTCDVAVYLFR